MVHIVQSRAKTTPYGTGQKSGNVYYKWPSWIPILGVTVIELPVSNFDLSLNGYEAYDKDRVPFMIDVTAFFRINNTAEAAQRVASIQEMREQLELIVKGAVRKVLASDVIDAIMVERSKFGDQFTHEVKDQLIQWGVESVKAMELMDIRDTKGFEVIANIMAKKTSFIAMESRLEVASNHRKAENAEIEAEQAISVRQQESQQVVGERTAQKDKLVGIAQQQAQQEVLEQEKETRERQMAVQRVQQVRAAEISKDEKVVAAEQDKATRVIMADGSLLAQIKEAEGIEKLGEARAAAEKAMQLAPVQANITLAKEIGQNAGYQQYLAMIEAIKAYITVGGEQAKALQKADVKVIANAGQPTEGVKNVMDMFTSKGGTNMAAMIEALAQTPMGAKLLATFIGNNSDNAEATIDTEA
ncbi:MAG: SPFH domain-containing protein [Patescibacteria group bacterium]|jgi:flotillin